MSHDITHYFYISSQNNLPGQHARVKSAASFCVALNLTASLPLELLSAACCSYLSLLCLFKIKALLNPVTKQKKNNNPKLSAILYNSETVASSV